ncbi:MAG: 4-hydroxy-tetrahydrodipicolinate reductase [Chloroflexi bacterium]|nr:4-hydroxy-tetrahydrodipicolinate reductase [Chloroflexota bacterium]
MEPIRVIVHGALGRMGQEVVKAVSSDPDLQLVGAVDSQVSDSWLALPDGPGKAPLSSDLKEILASANPQVMVDFSIARATIPAVQLAAQHGVNVVIGTTGLSADEIAEIDQLAVAHKIGAVAASNFALGAVLMMHLARIAAKYFDHCEIIELHHHRKVDAPSGTAISTARGMSAARGGPFSHSPGEELDSRGQQVEGIAIHSVRLPGLMAHQEVIMGGPGQTLSIRHDTINRECYMPGVIMAVKEVVKRTGLVCGLDNLLGL